MIYLTQREVGAAASAVRVASLKETLNFGGRGGAERMRSFKFQYINLSFVCVTLFSDIMVVFHIQLSCKLPYYRDVSMQGMKT